MGSPISDAGTPSDAARRPSSDAVADAVPGAMSDRLEAARELGRAHRAIGAMRAFFWTVAVVAGLGALAGEGWARWMFVATAAAFVFGAIDVRRRPVGWSVVLAVLITMLALASVASDSASVRRQGLVATLAVAAWTSVPWMRRTRALLAKYPDSFAARRITGAPRRAKQGDGGAGRD